MAQDGGLGVIHVYATRVEESIEKIPISITSVGQDEIQLGTEQLGLDESLARVPGLFMVNRYNFAQDLRASIRGFGARSSFGIRGIKIIVDGIPETLPDGQSSVDGIDIGSTSRITVIRGPTSSLYGNASGGAILIETESGQEQPFIEASRTSGGFGFNKLQIKAGGDTGKNQYLTNISKTLVDGYRDHNEFKNTQLNMRLETSLSASSSLSTSIHHTDQPYAEDPGGLTLSESLANPSQAATRNLTFDAGESLEQTRIGLIYKSNLSASRDLELRIYNANRNFDNKLPFQDGGAVTLDRSFTGGGIKYTTVSGVDGKNNRLLAGIDYDRQDDDRSRFNNLQGIIGEQTFEQNELVTSLGVFLQNETNLNYKTDLTLGVRYDRIEFDVTDHFLSDGDDSGSINFDQISPMLGINFEYSENAYLYSTISTAFETPTTTELANPTGGGFNQELKSQESINYEVGIKKFTENNRFQLTLFHIDVENELIPFELTDQPGRTFYENTGSSSRNGLELSYIRQLNRQTNLSLAYTHSDFKFDDFINVVGDSFDGNRIPGIPQDLFNVAISWFGDHGFYTKWNSQYIGGLYADNANRNRIESTTVSHIRFGHNAIFGDWEIASFMGINNLFDEDYNNNIRINAFGERFYEPAPERNAYIGISVRRRILER